VLVADDELDLDGEEASVLDPNIRRELREGRRARAQMEQELAASRREAALARAGIDDSTPLGKMFAKSYDGDISVDAIKAAAEEIPGLLPPPPPDPNAAGTEELEAQRRMAGSSGGSGVGGPDLRTTFANDVATLKARFEAGDRTVTMEDVMALVDSADPTLGIVRKGVQ
jgi:hypothetical protein